MPDREREGTPQDDQERGIAPSYNPTFTPKVPVRPGRVNGNVDLVECPYCKHIQEECMNPDKTAWECDSCWVVWETTPSGTRHHLFGQIDGAQHDGARGCLNQGNFKFRSIHPILNREES